MGLCFKKAVKPSCKSKVLVSWKAVNDGIVSVQLPQGAAGLPAHCARHGLGPLKYFTTTTKCAHAAPLVSLHAVRCCPPAMKCASVSRPQRTAPGLSARCGAGHPHDLHRRQLRECADHTQSYALQLAAWTFAVGQCPLLLHACIAGIMASTMTCELTRSAVLCAGLHHDHQVSARLAGASCRFRVQGYILHCTPRTITGLANMCRKSVRVCTHAHAVSSWCRGKDASVAACTGSSWTAASGLKCRLEATWRQWCAGFSGLGLFFLFKCK